MGRLFRIFFQPGSERSGKQCYYKHNGKGNNIVWIVKMECQSRSGKKEIENQHTDNRGQNPAQSVGCDYSGHKYA